MQPYQTFPKALVRMIFVPITVYVLVQVIVLDLFSGGRESFFAGVSILRTLFG